MVKQDFYIKVITTLAAAVTGTIFEELDEIGKILNWSSMTMHCLHDANDNINLNDNNALEDFRYMKKIRQSNHYSFKVN